MENGRKVQIQSNAAAVQRKKKMTPPAMPVTRVSSIYVEPIIAFYIFLAANAVAAFYAPIQDCDEVFNYWEPTHYLTHGYGFQTWEYSPDYAIRSWTYASMHAFFIEISRLVPFTSTKIFQFYFLRVVLGFFCAIAEARLFTKISQLLNPRIGTLFMLITLISPGMFHASTAYLPSSFAMYTTMLGLAAFLDWRGGIRTAQGIFWIGMGAVLGWPFAAAMVLPFVAEEMLLASLSGREGIEVVTRFLDGAVRTLIVLALQFFIDVFFYRKIACVSLNLIWYNVVAASQGKGPNIYGTEPWHFYIRNLLLNFNIWFVLALASMPLLLFQEFVRRKPATKQSYLRTMIFLSPFYIWLAIFTLQPHKEERFMYPLYPTLVLNAAVSAHLLLNYLGSTNPYEMASMIPAKIKFAIVIACLLATIDLGILRTVGTVTAYSAPLNVYRYLHEPNVTRSGDTVCLGKEWYRFPSSFFLPKGVKAKFVRSEFSGLLPGEFSEAAIGFGFFPGAWLVPSGMNDENKEDLSKYTDVAHCSFMIDSSLPSTVPTELEPDYVHDTATWEKLACQPFLDAAATSTLGRLIWVPEWSLLPAKYQRKWGEYCLLRRKSRK